MVVVLQSVRLNGDHQAVSNVLDPCDSITDLGRREGVGEGGVQVRDCTGLREAQMTGAAARGFSVIGEGRMHEQLVG